MKFATRSLLAVLVVVLVPFLNAQQQTATSAAAPTAASQSDAPDSCPHAFTVGANNNSILYCVTDTGAITTIETPIGHSMIGAGGEGYGLCQESPAAEYHDYAATWTNNWNYPQIVTLTKSVIKISRTTSDGNWTLVQTISKVAANASIKVVMALTNNQSVDKVAYLLRFADIDPNYADHYHSVGGASLESAWSWDATGYSSHYGLQLLNSSKSPFSYQQGFVYFDNTVSNACNFADRSASAGFASADDINVSVGYVYAGVVPAHQTLTVTLTYRRT
jgi:hypothetical protein